MSDNRYNYFHYFLSKNMLSFQQTLTIFFFFFSLLIRGYFFTNPYLNISLILLIQENQFLLLLHQLHIEYVLEFLLYSFFFNFFSFLPNQALVKLTSIFIVIY